MIENEILLTPFEERMRKAISVSWNIFLERLASGQISVSKEASMQFHYSNILNAVSQLMLLHPSEGFRIDLEVTTSEEVHGKFREIDLVLYAYSKKQDSFKIAVEMKCYRTKASSGKSRGATDIFMKDVYEDLQLLESYRQDLSFQHGIALVMTDYSNFIRPKNKNSKNWNYDISHGCKFDEIHLATPIGGKDVNITLQKSYHFDWVGKNNLYFLELEGQEKK